MDSKNEVITTGAAAGTGTLLVWLLGQFGVQMPPEVAVATVGLISTFLVHVIPHKDG